MAKNNNNSSLQAKACMDLEYTGAILWEPASTRRLVPVFFLAMITVFSMVLLTGCSEVKQRIQDVADTSLSEVASVEQSYETCTLECVVDGDTLIVLLDGNRETIRLIGIDAPESVHVDESRNCEEGRVASEHLKGMLEPGVTLWLERDTSDRDRYGRMLRYVWLSDPQTTELSTGMLNAILVADGFAQAKDYYPDSKYKYEFTELGRIAIENGAGVTSKWAQEVI